MNKEIKIETVMVPIEKLKFYEDNPRIWTDKETSDLTASIKRDGFLTPLLVNISKEREGVVLSGNFRLKIARDLGYKELPVNYVCIDDPDKERRICLALNRITGDWNFEKLRQFEIETLLTSGFDDFDLSHIFDDVLSVEDDDFNAEEVVITKNPRTKPGDLILLGQHRLYCGDNQNPESVKVLMGNERVNILDFDPIYNLGLNYDKGISGRNKYGGRVKDKMPDDAYRTFLKTALLNGLKYCQPDFHMFMWCDESHIGMIQSLYSELGIENKRVCLWIKNNLNPTPQVAFNKSCEYCIYGLKGAPYLSSVHNLTEILNKEIGTGNRLIDDILDLFNIWLVKRDSTQNYLHPTQKPPSLYEKVLRRCSRPGDIILDLYAGSGALMSAGEQLKRRVFMCELEPVFCDVIVQRYTQLTGKEPLYVNPEK